LLRAAAEAEFALFLTTDKTSSINRILLNEESPFLGQQQWPLLRRHIQRVVLLIE
jgi:hypothetical protein